MIPKVPIRQLAMTVLFLGAASLFHARDVIPTHEQPSPTAPQELGRIGWIRGYEKAVHLSKNSGKPLLLLFQEIPGCQGCKNYGEDPLSNPLIVDLVHEAFVPILINNIGTGDDLELCKRFREPRANYPVARFVDATGVELAPRTEHSLGAIGLFKSMVTALQRAQRPLPAYVHLVSQEIMASSRERATFAMRCFWEGERALGFIEGVVSTSIGLFDKFEVVELEFDPDVVSYSSLLEKAKKFECTRRVIARTDMQAELARKILGHDVVIRSDKPLEETVRIQQKVDLHKKPQLYYLPLTALQAMRLNVGGKVDTALLSPSQRLLSERLSALSPEKVKNLPTYVIPHHAFKDLAVDDRALRAFLEYAALPSDSPEARAYEAKAQGKLKGRPVLGVQLDPECKTGARVTLVAKLSAAEQAGLKVGDVITAIDGKEVASAATFSDHIKTLIKNQKVTLTLRREGETLQLEATPQWVLQP